MKNDSSAQIQALDLELFSKNQDTAMCTLEACSLSMDLARTLAMRIGLSIDEDTIRNDEIISMGMALQSFIQDILSKIEAAQKLTEVDMNKTCLSIRGIVLCLRETLRGMTMNKHHTCNVFFLVEEAMGVLSADVDALGDEIFESKNLVLSAYRKVDQNNKNTLTRPSSQRAANDPRDAA
jgi:hypothetical protein